MITENRSRVALEAGPGAQMGILWCSVAPTGAMMPWQVV